MESLFRWESRIALIPTSVPGKTYLNCNVQRPAAAASSQLKFDQQSLKDTVTKADLTARPGGVSESSASAVDIFIL